MIWLTRTISIQTAPQIRLVREMILMVEKIQSTVVNTIPLWKSQMVLALGAGYFPAQKLQKPHLGGGDDMTNELLKRNAENWKMAAY